ncbi:MAG: glycosyltransferase [Acidimicrobiales bacterium]
MTATIGGEGEASDRTDVVVGVRSSAQPVISVCMITRDRPEALDACLLALQSQVDAPPYELLVGCHGDEASAEVVRARFPSATVGVFDRANLGGARNQLIELARGELLLFLDDDVMFDDDLLSVLAKLAEKHPEASVFGGPNLTPPHSSLLQQVQGATLASVFGAGPVRRRYGLYPAGAADDRAFTLCNLAVRRDVAVPFAPKLSGGEENAMLKELADESRLMWYDPQFLVYHERRRTYFEFARQMEKYGRGRGQVMFHKPGSFRLVYLVPAFLVFWLVSIPIVSVLVWSWWWLTLVAYSAFLVVAGVSAARKMQASSRRGSLGAVVLAAVFTATIHVCYGVGLLRGLLRTPEAPVTTWTMHSEAAHSETAEPEPNPVVQSARL